MNRRTVNDGLRALLPESFSVHAWNGNVEGFSRFMVDLVGEHHGPHFNPRYSWMVWLHPRYARPASFELSRGSWTLTPSVLSQYWISDRDAIRSLSDALQADADRWLAEVAALECAP